MKNIISKSLNTINSLIEKVKKDKKLMYTLCLAVLVLFSLALNVAFSAFTNTSSSVVANIKVKDMEFAMTINEVPGTIITATKNDYTKSNIIITSLNSIDAKYELIYHICSDSKCETFIEKPAGLIIESSSKSVNPITGTISASGNKSIRLVMTNTSNSTYYIKLDLNAGYTHNTLALLNMITSVYDEDDVIIASYINGTLQSSFPTTKYYAGTVTCTVHGEASNATGEAKWNGTNWVVNIYGANTGETRCNVNFITQYDTSGANPPNLAANMIPVYYDNATDSWKKADSTNYEANWYNYDDFKWANAVTVTSGTRSTYGNAAVGTPITMSDIMGMWVWIPRYEYMTSNLGTNYAGGSQNYPGTINVKFVSINTLTPDSGYLIHPSFRNGNEYFYHNAYDLGGWDKELSGFWMGKYETGYASYSTESPSNAVTAGILIKPDLFPLNNQYISKQYETAQNVQSDHGLDSKVESHMSKNDEWGAVTYLSQSTYGKKGNPDYSTINKEIYINNATYSTTTAMVSSNKKEGYTLLDNEIAFYIDYYHFITGRSAGTYGGNTSAILSKYGTYEYNNCPASADAHTNCTESDRTNNNTLGTGASTTGTIYGIYDMSGGAEDNLMANYLGSVAYSQFSSMPSQKYYNKYTSANIATACNGSPCYGQALSETGTGTNSGNYQWYNDYMLFPTDTDSKNFMARGFNAQDTANVKTGIFSANAVSGTVSSYSTSHLTGTFRVTLS